MQRGEEDKHHCLEEIRIGTYDIFGSSQCRLEDGVVANHTATIVPRINQRQYWDEHFALGGGGGGLQRPATLFYLLLLDTEEAPKGKTFVSVPTPIYPCTCIQSNRPEYLLFLVLSDLNQAVPNHLAGPSSGWSGGPVVRMVRWCIRLTRLTLVCEVIRYRLVQVRQNQKRLFGLAARNRLSLSLPLSFSPLSYFLSFSIQKRVLTIVTQ